MKLKGKLAVVVGASGGIGREVVKALYESNVNVILIARRKNVLKPLAKEAEKFGVKSYIYTADIGKPKKILKVTSKIKRRFKKIDMLFNAAGIGVYGKLEELDGKAWQKSLDIDVTAPFLFTKHLMPALKNAKRSYVVNFGSGMGKIAVAGRSAYCASKFALRGMSLALSKEYKKSSVNICLLTLGSVMTGFGPLSLEDKKKSKKKGKRYLDPQWLAGLIVTKIENDTLEGETSIYPKDYYKQSRRGKTAKKAKK